MARWGIENGSDHQKRVWVETFYRDTLINNFFTALEGMSGKTPATKKSGQKYICPKGTDASNVICINRDLDAGKGDRLRFSIIEKLDPNKTIGEKQNVKKNLQKQTIYKFDSRLEWTALGTEVDVRMSEQRSGWNVSAVSHQQLLDVAVERRELDYIDAITSAPTLIIYPDGTTGNLSKTTSAVTAAAALSEANSIPTPNFFRRLYTAAKTGFNRTIYPLRGIKVPGYNKLVYIFVVHDDMVTTLKNSAAYQQMVREADVRGPDNPIFGMADLICNEILIVGHEKMPIYTDGGGASVPYAHGVLMGCQALVRAEGVTPKIVNETEDHETIEEWSYQYVQKTQKPIFNGVTYGSFSCFFSREQISDVA